MTIPTLRTTGAEILETAFSDDYTASSMSQWMQYMPAENMAVKEINFYGITKATHLQ